MTDLAASAGASSALSTRPARIWRIRFGGPASGVGVAGWGRTILAAILSFIYFFPVLWIILTAFKTYEDALAVPAKFIFTPTLENFVQVFNRSFSAGAQAQSTGFHW